MPNISVIVPVYKVEAFLHRCVDSLLAQTYPDFELILVDDGSPDNCGAICEEYAGKDSRVHVIHRQNGGLSAARNTGIDWVFANSDSQWLAFVDSDDWVHPNYLQLLLKAAEQENCRISVCGFYRSAGDPIPEDRQEAIVALTPEDYYCGDYHDGITAVAWNKLYHRSVFAELRYPEGMLHEDELTTYQAIFAVEKVAVTPVRLYGYYQNPKGIMNAQWSPKRMHMLEAFENQLAFARKRNLPRFRHKALEGLIFNAYGQLEQAPKEYRGVLRRKLARALILGNILSTGFQYRKIHWAYEAAFPCKLLWVIVEKVRQL